MVAILRRVPGDQAFTVDERPVSPQLGFRSDRVSDSQLGDIHGRQRFAPEADLLDGPEERPLAGSVEADLKRACRGADAVGRIAAQRFQVPIDVDPHGVVVAVEDGGDMVPTVGLDASGGRFQKQLSGPDAGGGRGAQGDVPIGMEPQSVFAVLAATGAVGRIAFPQDVLPLAWEPVGPDPGADRQAAIRVKVGRIGDADVIVPSIEAQGRTRSTDVERPIHRRGGGRQSHAVGGVTVVFELEVISRTLAGRNLQPPGLTETGGVEDAFAREAVIQIPADHEVGLVSGIDFGHDSNRIPEGGGAGVEGDLNHGRFGPGGWHAESGTQGDADFASGSGSENIRRESLGAAKLSREIRPGRVPVIDCPILSRVFDGSQGVGAGNRSVVFDHDFEGRGSQRIDLLFEGLCRVGDRVVFVVS